MAEPKSTNSFIYKNLLRLFFLSMPPLSNPKSSIVLKVWFWFCYWQESTKWSVCLSWYCFSLQKNCGLEVTTARKKAKWKKCKRQSSRFTSWAEPQALDTSVWIRSPCREGETGSLERVQSLRSSQGPDPGKHFEDWWNRPLTDKVWDRQVSRDKLCMRLRKKDRPYKEGFLVSCLGESSRACA